MTIGERIALLRKQAGLSQEKLASLIGVSRQAIGKWESNLSLPGIDNLQELAAVLHVSCDELITGSSSIGQNNDGNGQIALESVKELIEQGELSNRQSARRRFLFSLLPALLACVLALGCLAVSYFSFSQIQALEDRLSSLDAAIAVLQNPVYLGTDSGGTANQSSQSMTLTVAIPRCPAETVCAAYLYAVAEEGGAFLDFVVKGEADGIDDT